MAACRMRIDWCPGYRVYFARIGTTLLLLLCAGDKTTQPQDIERAKSYLQDYKERTVKPQGPQKRQGKGKGRKRAV
jgi:hypothetical protein